MSAKHAIKVLLIVDDWEALDLYEAQLGKEFEAIPVFFGSHALSTAEDANADVALIDLVSGEMDGLDLEQSFRAQERYKKLPIALILPHDGEGQVGAQTRVFQRPFVFEAIREHLESVARSDTD